MLALGMTHAQVGDAVNRLPGTIASQLSKGYIAPAKNVEKLDLKGGDRRPWSEDEDTLVDLLSRRGWPPAKLALMLCRTTSAIYTRKHRLGIVMTRYPSRQEPKSSWRPCICCGREFRSEGIHNKICQRCKDSDLCD